MKWLCKIRKNLKFVKKKTKSTTKENFLGDLEDYCHQDSIKSSLINKSVNSDSVDNDFMNNSDFKNKITPYSSTKSCTRIISTKIIYIINQGRIHQQYFSAKEWNLSEMKKMKNTSVFGDVFGDLLCWTHVNFCTKMYMQHITKVRTYIFIV